MSKLFTRSHPLLVALSVATLALSACSSDPPADPADAGPDVTADGGEKEKPDGGNVDAGPPSCTNDDECPANQRCSDSKACIPTDPCQDDPSTCRQFDYCDTVSGLGCRCVKSDLAEAPFNGFCKRRLPSCTPCETDDQCGNDITYFETPLHNEGACVMVPELGHKVCLERYSAGKCGCGKAMVTADGKSYCTPQDVMSCAQGAFVCCGSDSECPAEHPLCDLDTGLCRDSCSYDFAESKTVGCRSNHVCNVNPTLLDETKTNFGSGSCSKPCTSEAQCKSLRSDFVCLAEPGNPGSEPRCRPPGCLSNFECGQTELENPHMAFCQRSSGQCICDPNVVDGECFCRTGEDAIDPATGLERVDCKPGFKCDQGACVKQNCVEMGGGDIACGYDEFCCGEDRNGNGDLTDDLCVDGGGQTIANHGDCYLAPRPPWCKACAADADCTGPGMPSSQLDPNRCFLTETGPMCHYACSHLSECPGGFACTEVRVGCSEVTGGTPATCGDPSRCIEVGKDEDGNPISYCQCSNPQERGVECPDPTRCNNGGTWCISTQVCQGRAGNCLPLEEPEPPPTNP